MRITYLDYVRNQFERKKTNTDRNNNNKRTPIRMDAKQTKCSSNLFYKEVHILEIEQHSYSQHNTQNHDPLPTGEGKGGAFTA